VTIRHMLLLVKVHRLISAAAWFLSTASPVFAEPLREGDIVFTSSERGQGEAIIEATGSDYNHCGIVFQKDGKLMVLEAVQPVGVVSLQEFKSRSKPGTFLARRLKTPLAPEKYREARIWAEAQIGKNYDVRFLWDDGKLYCSELVWKIYHKAGVELCELRRFRDYDLEKPSVQKIIKERFGGPDHLPLDEKVVAPSDLAESVLLVNVPSQP
jgi:Permuted papain-like amidase enzyme, YaeF/YiiX, C92 family